MPQPPIRRPTPPPQEHDWRPGQRGSIHFGRLRLDIEPGTFSEPVRLHLRVPDAPPPIPEHLTMPFVFRVEARRSGGQLVRALARQIRFSLDFSDMAPLEWGQGFVSLYYYDETARRWTMVPGQTDMAARRIVAQVGHFTDFGFGGDANQLPSIPSSLEGYQVDLCSGHSNATVALKVPPGTAGLTPDLTLRYNSGVIDTMNGHWIRDGNNTGNENARTRLQSSPVGFGWSLDLGAIFRSHTQDAGGHEIFYLLLNGTTYRLAYIDGTTYRGEPDDYLRIRTLTGGQGESPNGSYWIVETKDGTEYRFGYTANSEQIDAIWNEGGYRYAWQWNLDRIKDTHGNIIEMSYLVQSAQTGQGYTETHDQAAYPQYITYTGRADPHSVGSRQIELKYVDRTDFVNVVNPVPQFRSQSGATGYGCRCEPNPPNPYRDPYSVPRPTGATVGDILIAVSWSGTDRDAADPSGWTEVQDLHHVSPSDPSGSLKVYWRQVVADEPDSYVFYACPWSNTYTQIYCWYNVDPSDPIEASAITRYHPQWGYARVPGATTTTSGGMWLAFLLAAPNPNGDFAPDGTWTVGYPWNGQEHSRYMYKGLGAAGTVPDYDIGLGSTNPDTIQASVFLRGAGVPVTPYTQFYSKKRLDRIEMSVGGTLVRAYDFAYEYKKPYWHTSGSSTQLEGRDKLVLTSITEKDASSNALPATTLTCYQGAIPNTNPQEYYKLQLHEVQNGYGGKVTYEYEGHTPNGWCPLTRRYRVKQKSVESGVGSAGGESSTIVQSYGYGTSYYVPDTYDYRGHAEVTVTDSAEHYEKSYFYTRDAANGKTDPAEIERLQQRRYKLERWKSGGTAPSAKEETAWSAVDTQAGAFFVRLDAIRQYQGDASRKTRFEYDGYGNVIRTQEYASATAADTDWVRQTRRWYNTLNGTDHYIVGKLTQEIVYRPDAQNPPDGEWVRATRYLYDGSTRWDNSIGSGADGDDSSYRGRLTTVRRNLNDTDCVDVSNAYDAYGNRTSEKEYNSYGVWSGAIASGDARETVVAYEETYHTFPQTITNPLDHVEMRDYDAKWGKPIQLIDPSGGVTNYEYDTFGRLKVVRGPQVTGPSGNSYRRTTDYTYDPPAEFNGRITNRLMIKTRNDLGGTEIWLTTQRFYDGIGRVIQEYSDGYSGVNVVNSYYDWRGLKWRDSVSHAATGTGSFLDGDWANYAGAATTYTFDELRRPLDTTLPDTKIIKWAYVDWIEKVVDQNGHWKSYERDALGRTVKVREYSSVYPAETLYATTSYGYDVLDRLTGVTDEAANVTTIDYDKLGRKVSLSDPDMGSWTYAYDPIGTLQSQTDAKSQTVSFYYDALKRLVRKWYPASWTQPNITANSSKPTVYDLMELRAAVDVNRKAAGMTPSTWTDPVIIAGTGVRVRALHFTDLRTSIQDLWTAAGLGTLPQFTGGAIAAETRKIKASDLTDLRGWLATYETYENGEWGLKRAARVFMEYDAYNGVSQFGKGKRTALWDVCGRQSFWWDKAGRITREERTIDGALYVTQWSYDAMDRVYQLAYPDNEVLTHSYSGNGLLSGIQSSLGTTDLVSGVQYNALNLPSNYWLGSGVTAQVSHQYYGPDAPCWPISGYAGPYGAVKTIQLRQGTNPYLVNRDMLYDPVGNVGQITDAVNGETIGYTYDHLDRLLSASAPAGETYTYNEIGNITTKNGASFSYDLNHKHAVSAYNGTTYSYDANGCLTTTTARGGQTIGYDPESRPARVDSGATICRFAYDGNGARRKRLDSKGTIHYVGPYERNVGNGIDATEVVTKYYFASFGNVSRVIAFRRAGVLYYVGTDHLGGTIRVADANFNAVDGMRYLPYGGSRDQGTNLHTDHKFTSQIEDASIGLYWYASRAYDPAIGRFLIPDNIVPDPANPQALNRYSYTFNNPVRYTDPAGHDPNSEDGSSDFRVSPDSRDDSDLRRIISIGSSIEKGV
ncbi:MAG: hypothetical protein EPO21_23565 [Chloroflexota bacterium]|nr:MAG: hypothetical protein EPO21_23565 [Chloroflexota bacterium]